MSNISTHFDARETPLPDGNAALRVCHVGPYPNRGGGIASVTQMLVGRQDADPALTVDAIPTSIDGGSIGKLVAFARSTFAVRRQCRKSDGLVLHIHTSFGRSFARKALLMKIAERYGVPVLLHIHGSEFDKWYERQTPRGQRAIRLRFDRVGRIVVVSDSWNDYISRLTDTPVVTVHNAVDVARYAFDRSYDRPATFGLLFLGGVGLRRKGAFDLLEATERVKEKHPALPIRLKIAGHGEIDEVREWIAVHGLSDSVEVPGWIGPDEKERLLREADVFVLPSYHEGLPIALLESMASGLPIVVSPVGGIPEAIEDGRSGLFVAPGDVAGLAAALESVLLDSALRERLGRQAQWTVRDSFDLPVAADAFKTLYAELYAEAPPRG